MKTRSAGKGAQGGRQKPPSRAKTHPPARLVIDNLETAPASANTDVAALANRASILINSGHFVKALGFNNDIAARLEEGTDPILETSVLLTKAWLLGGLRREDEARKVCEDIAARFGDDAGERDKVAGALLQRALELGRMIELDGRYAKPSESKAPVEKSRKTSYKRRVKAPPDIGALEKKLDLIEAEFGEAAKEAFARRAPARDGAVNSGMAARGRDAAPAQGLPALADGMEWPAQFT